MVIWEPDNKINGILQINHGLGDYILRYDEIATFFNRGDLAVVGIDLIGHGNSTNNGEKVMYFGGNGSYQNLIEDINVCVDYVKQLYPDTPYAMLGYSIGAYLTQAYMLRYGTKIDGTILVGPTYKSKMKLNTFRRKINKEIKKMGDKSMSPNIEKIVEKAKKNVNSKYDYLLLSETKKQEYMNDTLKSDIVTLGVYRDILECIEFVRTNKLNDMDKTKPVYILAGKNDVMCDYGKDITLLYKDLQSNNYSDVLVKMYDGIKRDILHEDNRYDIYNDIYGWIRYKLLRSVLME